VADMPALQQEVESGRLGAHLFLNCSKEQFTHGQGGDFCF